MKYCILIAILAVGCGDEPKVSPTFGISREPVSVRGWIKDIEGSGAGDAVKTVETEAARRKQMFQNTTLWVENAPYVSGGVAEDGSFIILDVPPGKAVVSFNAPGAETARIEIDNVPGNVDVVIPGLILKKGGSTVADPAKIQVRMPSMTAKQPTPTSAFATIGGHRVPVIDTPLRLMTDRRDFPPPPGSLRPVAIVR
jgi:hypothetical protein